jgi:hypothetical protein
MAASSVLQATSRHHGKLHGPMLQSDKQVSGESVCSGASVMETSVKSEINCEVQKKRGTGSNSIVEKMLGCSIFYESCRNLDFSGGCFPDKSCDSKRDKAQLQGAVHHESADLP